MGQQIIKQTLVDGKPLVIDGEECQEGLFAVWSSIVDNFIAFNLSYQDVIDFHVEAAVEREKRETVERLDRADKTGSSGRCQFKKLFSDAAKWAVEVHGVSAFDEHEDDE